VPDFICFRNSNFLCVGSPCGGSHFVNHVLNEMGIKCDIETVHPGQSLVMWAYAPGYNASLPDNVKNPPEELLEKNYKWAKHTYDYVIHYTRHPLKSIPCLQEEMCAVKKDLDEEYFNIMRKGVFNGLKKANWDFMTPPWQNLKLNRVEYVLDFWVKWHKMILLKKPDITIKVENFKDEIYKFVKDKTQCKNNADLDTSVQHNTGSRRKTMGRPTENKEMEIFIREMLPKINIQLLQEVVKLGNKFGYEFPNEVVLKCKHFK